MSGLRGFLQQRQRPQVNSQRQVFGNQYKVPVPVTTLDRTSRSSHGLNARRASPQQDNHHERELHFDQAIKDHGDAFDTDAEGLDDTTITSGGFESQGLQGSLPGPSHDGQTISQDNGLSHQPARSSGVSYEWRQDSSKHDQLEAQDPILLGDDESYEESEEEDDEEADDDGASEGQLTQEGRRNIGIPRYFHSGQDETIISDEEAMKRVTESPTMNQPMLKNARTQFSRASQPSLSRAQSIASNTAEFNIDLQRGHLQQSQAGITPNLTVSLSRKGKYDPKAPTETSGAVPVDEQPVPQPSITSSPSPQLEAQPERAELGTEAAKSTVHNSPPNKGPSETMLPPLHSTGGVELVRLQERFKDDIQPTISHEPLPGFTCHAGREQLGVDAVHRSTSTGFEVDKKFRRQSRGLDYGLDQLASMSFQHLVDEAFEFDPSASGPMLPSSAVGGTLLQKLDYLVKVKDHQSRASQQKAFLATLPIEDYEECGDLLVERFSDIIKKYKNARQERRKAVQDFEKEVARREECVRGKIEAFEHDFLRLKRGGEDVVKKRLA